MKDEIEAEVQARVAFKMNELLTVIKNNASTNWALAFKSGNAKYANYWEALGLMEQWFKKELMMATPSDNMALDFKRKQKAEAIDSIMNEINRFGYMTGREQERIIRFLVRTIEKLQN